MYDVNVFFFSKYLWLSGFAFCARVLNVASSLYNMHPPFGKLALLLLLWRCRQSPLHLVFTHMVSTLHRNVISSRTQNLTISILQSKDVFLTCTNPHQDQCNIFVRVRNKWRMHHLFFFFPRAFAPGGDHLRRSCQKWTRYFPLYTSWLSVYSLFSLCIFMDPLFLKAACLELGDFVFVLPLLFA